MNALDILLCLGTLSTVLVVTLFIKYLNKSFDPFISVVICIIIWIVSITLPLVFFVGHQDQNLTQVIGDKL